MASPVHNSEPAQALISNALLHVRHYAPKQAQVARRLKICRRQHQLDVRTFTSCQYPGVYRALQRHRPKKVRALAKPGRETTRDRKLAYWWTHPGEYRLMRQESEAGKWYDSPREHLWYKVNANECSGTWNCNTGNGYYGGLQMDRQFQRTYNPEAYALWGTANNWPVSSQMLAADRAYASRGLQPWPHSYATYGFKPVP